MMSSEKVLEIIESLVNAIHQECKEGRQMRIRPLVISLREAKDTFELLRREKK